MVVCLVGKGRRGDGGSGFEGSLLFGPVVVELLRVLREFSTARPGWRDFSRGLEFLLILVRLVKESRIFLYNIPTRFKEHAIRAEILFFGSSSRTSEIGSDENYLSRRVLRVRIFARQNQVTQRGFLLSLVGRNFKFLRGLCLAHNFRNCCCSEPNAAYRSYLFTLSISTCLCINCLFSLLIKIPKPTPEASFCGGLSG